MGESKPKYLLFGLLSLDLNAGPKNISGFLQAIWKSIFISSHSTPLANVALVRGTVCSFQSLWRRAAAHMAMHGSEQPAFYIHSLKRLER
jgi:hypothetical protein